MKLEEAIEILSNELRIITDLISYYRNFENCNDMALAYRIKRQKAMETAISALKEVQRYRQIGNVEAIKAICEEKQRWHTYRINENIKNPFANTSTLICHNCDHKDEYIEELEAEIEEYRLVGTVEECHEAVEKQKPASRVIIEGKYFCPNCKNLMPYPGYCGCGQKVY